MFVNFKISISKFNPTFLDIRFCTELKYTYKWGPQHTAQASIDHLTPYFGAQKLCEPSRYLNYELF